MDEIRRHYYLTHRQLNPSGVVATMPALDFSAAHGESGSAQTTPRERETA
jgi:glutathionyl-hydroquinone reductase